jgi:hypothetical protein
MSAYAAWNQYTAYAIGDVVNYAGFDYVAAAPNQNVPPSPPTPTWTLLTPPGGVTTLSIAGDDVVANPGGSAADISTTTTVAATATKTTKLSYDVGILLTSVDGDFDVKSGITQKILLATSGNITADGNLKAAAIEDAVGSLGAAGQVLTAGVGSQLLWAAGGGGADLAGLYNKLAITPAAGATSSTVLYDPGAGGVGYPSAWIPDLTGFTAVLPTNTGPGTPWRLTKPAGGGGTGHKWWVWPYNPQYLQALPYSPLPASATFLKKNLKACWALVKYKGSVPLNTQGAFFFNIYTYDYTNIPPSTQPYSTRFDYNANNLALPLTTGALALQGEFTYLVYCLDADKIVANPALGTTIAQANGQTPNQLTTEMLRDPYDIETTRNHLGLSAVAYTAGGAIVPSDINNVPVLGIALSCTSSSIASGVDFEVQRIGYVATAEDASTINVAYTLNYS